MAVTFTVPLQNYVRAAQPPLKGSEAQWLQEELKKLERTTAAINAALTQLAARVT
jgi:hypothetical protein